MKSLYIPNYLTITPRFQIGAGYSAIFSLQSNLEVIGRLLKFANTKHHLLVVGVREDNRFCERFKDTLAVGYN